MPNEKDRSIVDEVFFWMEKNQTREQILMRGKTAQLISTPKMTGRSLIASPGPSKQFNQATDTFSPMTLSRAAVSAQNPGQGF